MSATTPVDDGVLDLLGVYIPDSSVAARPDRLTLWRSNESAFSVFLRVSGHEQWLRNPVDPNQIIGIDGSYLLQYLLATEKKSVVPSLLDDIHYVVRGWVKGRGE